MDTIASDTLHDLFAHIATLFAENRDYLIDLDSRVGDSDLGITMCKAFDAAKEETARLKGQPIGTQLKKVGAAMSAAAPSTMGTLTATGFLRGGKAVGDVSEIDLVGWAAFWRAYVDGVAERGKANLGDKTVLDVLEPIATSFERSSEMQVPMMEAFENAVAEASNALEATKGMIAQRGKAAAFGDRTLGLQDAGGTVAKLLIEGLASFAHAEGGRPKVL